MLNKLIKTINMVLPRLLQSSSRTAVQAAKCVNHRTLATATAGHGKVRYVVEMKKQTPKLQ